MRISVVMALYNGAEYLTQQLESILGQTVPPDEVILSDDGSTDETVRIAKEFITRRGLSGRWRVFEQKKNLGYAENFYFAAGKAAGDVLFFSDQDDLWLPDKIERMLAVMEPRKDCCLLSTDYEPFADSENAQRIPADIRKRMPGDGSLERIALSPKNIYIGAIGCCMAVRRSFYEQAAKYRFAGWAQDDFLWKIAQAAGVSYLWHVNLVRHRIHGANTSTYGNYHERKKRLAHFYGMRKAAVRMLKAVGELPEPQIDDERTLRRHIRMLSLRIELMEKRKLRNAVLLLPYLGYYEKPRSYLIELLIALKK